MRRGFSILALTALLFACTPAPIATEQPAPTGTKRPAATTAPTATLTVTPSPIPSTPTATPLPGVVVLPVDTLANGIPWLPLDKSARPRVHVILFNTLRPPFNSALVRQAFAAAIDREEIVAMAQKYGEKQVKPATTLTPPQTLGRDLYNEVGIRFDPEHAKALFAEAGYTDPSAFPVATIVVNSYGEVAPGARFNMASAMARMWQEYLGVKVQVEAMKPPSFGDRLRTDPPELMWFGWAADFNDPDNFMQIVHSGSEYNYGKFSSPEYDKLVDRAGSLKDPAQRQELYIRAEYLVTEFETAIFPLYHLGS